MTNGQTWGMVLSLTPGLSNQNQLRDCERHGMDPREAPYSKITSHFLLRLFYGYEQTSRFVVTECGERAGKLRICGGNYAAG